MTEAEDEGSAAGSGGQGSQPSVQPPKRPRDDAEFAALIRGLIDRFPRILARLAR